MDEDITAQEPNVETPAVETPAAEDLSPEATAAAEEASLDEDFAAEAAEETSSESKEDKPAADTDDEQTPEEKADAEAAAAEDSKTPEEKAQDVKDAAKVVSDAKKQTDAEAAEKLAASKKVEPTAEELAAQTEETTKQTTASREAFMAKITETLKDKVIGDGGSDDAPMPTTIAEFTESFPEIAAAIGETAGAMYDHMAEVMAPIREMLEAQTMKATQSALFTELSGESFGHPDASEIIPSDAFQDWIGEQSPAYQKLIDAAVGAKDVSRVLSQFKSDTGVQTTDKKTAAEIKAAKVADGQRDKKAATDKLHSATNRSRTPVKSKASGEPSEKDLDDDFNEAAAEKS